MCVFLRDRNTQVIISFVLFTCFSTSINNFYIIFCIAINFVDEIIRENDGNNDLHMRFFVSLLNSACESEPKNVLAGCKKREKWSFREI